MMQRKLDQAPRAHNTETSITVTTKLAEKRSKQFLQEVLYPRSIKVISDSLHRGMLKSLQKDLRFNQLALKDILRGAFVELDAPEVVKDFEAIVQNSENEAMFEAEYRDTFLKNGGFRNLNVVCRYIQPRMIVEGQMQNTWIPPPVVIDRRESGIAPSTTVWNLVSNIYPDKVGDDRDKYFIPDHIYAINAKDEGEKAKIRQYHRVLPAFLLRKGSKPPYLVEESKDHIDKECEARQYLSLIAASALHNHMLLRSLSNEAQAKKTIELDPGLCIYGMTCCAELVSIYKMGIHDIWSDPGLENKIKKAVRYDFVRVDSIYLTTPSDCGRLSNWMNTLHLYGRTVHADSVMKDGKKAFSGRKFESGDWQRDLTKVAFCYGEQPNTATFTGYTSIDNEDNEDSEDSEDSEDIGEQEKQKDKDEEEGQGGRRTRTRTRRQDEEEEAADHPAPKRQKVGNGPCNHACRDQKTRRNEWCKHNCCEYSRQLPI
jgi:hypothetical protein